MRTVLKMRPHVPVSGLFIPRGEEARAWARLVLLVVVPGMAMVLLLLPIGKSASPLVRYLPLADPVHELQDCDYTPLETRSAASTAAQCVWHVLREWPLKRD